MEFEFIDSSHLTGAFYDETSATLYLQFKGGTIYEYYDVPDYVYHELMAAESKGTYAHENIYKTYKQQKIG